MIEPTGLTPGYEGDRMRNGFVPAGIPLPPCFAPKDGSTPDEVAMLSHLPSWWVGLARMP
jgi:hypothetical protein